jgi:class 3 adenylate cyclase/tetratricopeptide (TPR) repeat protein
LPVDIRTWLRTVGLEQHAEVFEREQIDFEALRHLTASDLKELDLPMGPRAKLLAAIANSFPAPSHSPPPQAYTPSHLAERILTTRAALEGERKQVTVLFADLKGSMELLAERDPEEARRILDPVLERMMQAVHRYEGTVNQVMGDGIMALFGAPLAHEDHAVRACYAALEMQRAVRQYSERMRVTEGLETQIRVGINSGEVVVRAIGNDLHMDYSAIGQTTHLAARMEQLAPPGSTRLTIDTLRLAEGYVQVQALGSVPVKGLPSPVEIFELLGASAARTRMQAIAARGLTRFVGRNSELAVLEEALERARKGDGRLVAVVGDPGVGKSRLLWEITHSHRSQGCLVLEAGSVSYGKATSWRPVIDLLKTYFGVEDRDDARRITEKVTGRLLSLDRALEPALPAMLALLDVPVDDAAWQLLDPPQRRLRILDGCRRLLLREARVQPLLVVFEDLHWIDTETQAFLDALVEALPGARIVMLVNYRPEYRNGWVERECYTQLRLEPLAAENADELLSGLLGTDAHLQPLRELLIARTEGNPLFIEESVRTLVEIGALTGERGAYRMARELASIQVPGSVQAVLASRIDRLDGEDKALLQMAAAIGKDVPQPLLLAIAGLAEQDLMRRLARLQAAEFLYEASLFPDPEYTFKHALTHEVAYGSLLQEQRRSLHGRIVDAIEATYPGRLDEHVERLAQHASRGELWPRAATLLNQAAEKAASRSANREAVALFEQALSALDHLPREREVIERQIDLRFRIRTCLVQIAAYGRVRQYLEEAEQLARGIGDERRLGWVLCYLGQFNAITSEAPIAIETCTQALLAGRATEDLSLQIASRFFLGLSHLEAGNYVESTKLQFEILGLLKDEWWREQFGIAGPVSIWSRCLLIFGLAELGEFAEGISRAQEATALAREANHSYALAGLHYNFGYLQVLKGDADVAIDVLRRGLDLCRTRDLPFLGTQITAALGYAYLLDAQTSEAIALLETAIPQCLELGLVQPRTKFTNWLGEALLQAGRVPEALAQAESALALARTCGALGPGAWSLRLRAEALRRAGGERETARAADDYLEAVSIATERHMRPLQAHCHLGMGRLHAELGHHVEARAEVEAARWMYREMEMTRYVREVDQELARMCGTTDEAGG